jgi:flagellar hook-basal body complex protein FliE
MNVGGALSGLSSLTPSAGNSGPKAAGADFGDALKQAVGALGQLGQQADSSSMRLAAGQPIDIHEVMLNTEQASIVFSLALQVRNKLVDAYQEIMRMSV